MYIKRYFDALENDLKPGKVLLIYGPRQVGKTTLIKQYLTETKAKYLSVNGDNLDVQQILNNQDSATISEYVRGFDIFIIDEAQKVPGIGLGLKIMVDTLPKIKVIATGSSSFELAGQVGEPLTGRKRTVTLFPLATLDLALSYNRYELKRLLPDQLIYGGYPEVVALGSNDKEKQEVLDELVNSYLLKDILELEQVKGSKILLDLLQLLAFQVGSEVSLSELGTQLGIDYKTVDRYLDLFEKSFIIYSLRGFSRNLRKEIRKKAKYYFFDNGVRNAIINNFNPLAMRDDVGKLWENYLFMERLKKRSYTGIYATPHFWRTYDQKEVDLVEERDGKLFGYEFKWSDKKIPKAPKDWLGTYPEASYEVITQENYLEFISA